jgi:FixJ family two-component response regulator
VPKAKPLISIVDDDESMREAIRGLMRSLGYRVEEPLMDEDVLGWIREQAAGVRYPRAALRPSACIRKFLTLPL